MPATATRRPPPPRAAITTTDALIRRTPHPPRPTAGATMGAGPTLPRMRPARTAVTGAASARTEATHIRLARTAATGMRCACTAAGATMGSGDGMRRCLIHTGAMPRSARA